MRFIAALAALLLLPAAAAAGTLRVPTEEYPNIQAAMNACADGDTILVSPGAHFVGGYLPERSRVRIRGLPGANIVGGQFGFFRCDRVTVEGFTFVSALETGNGLIANECTRMTLKNLVAEGYSAAAFRFIANTGSRVTGCTVQNGTGVGVRDVGSADLVVEKCTFTGLGGVALDLSASEGLASDRARVSKCVVTASGGGFLADGADLRFEGNTIEIESGNGIRIGDEDDSPRALVQKNTVVSGDFDYRGLSIGSDGARVARNTVEGALGIGIYVVGDGTRVEGNTALGGFQGIHVSGSDATVSRNVAGDALSIAIFVTQGARAEVARNRVVDPAGNSTGISVSSQDAVVTRNTVAPGAGTGFYLEFPPMTLVGNVSEGATFADVLSNHSEASFTLLKNRFTIEVFDYNPEPPI